MTNELKYDIVIIGSGLGGLLTGALLSKQGYNVCIVEKNRILGGNLQTFKREGVVFDTGMHYFGSCDKDQFIYKLFNYLEIYNDLKLKRLDVDGFDIINFGDKEYKFAQGFDNFVDKLSSDFPDNKIDIIEFVNKIKDIGLSENIFNLIHSTGDEKDFFKTGTYYSQNAYKVISSITSNKTLQNVLSGLNGLIGAGRDKTNMFVMGMTYYSYIESAWRFVGGSQQLADALVAKIEKAGGTVINNSRVTGFVMGNDKTVEAVKTGNNTTIRGKYFISDIHPANTIKLLPKNLLRKVYVNRINRLKNSPGMFTVYLVLKKNKIGYFNYNYFDFLTDSTWINVDDGLFSWPQGYILLSELPGQNSEYASGLTIMTPIDHNVFNKWANTTVGRRGQDYEDLKNELAEKLLSRVFERFPKFKNIVKNYYTATPLTYRDYLGTPDGSAYGLIKDCEKPFETLVLPKTHIRNLLLTGQNINVHGMLGVSTGSLLTISYITDIKKIIKDISNAG